MLYSLNPHYLFLDKDVWQLLKKNLRLYNSKQNYIIKNLKTFGWIKKLNINKCTNYNWKELFILILTFFLLNKAQPQVFEQNFAISNEFLMIFFWWGREQFSFDRQNKKVEFDYFVYFYTILLLLSFIGV